MFRDDFLQVSPVARDAVIENVTERGSGGARFDVLDETSSVVD
jgi:hypothetical protein